METKKESLQVKNRIVQVALALFKEKGYQNVCVEEICQKVGITRSTFYYYFKKKEEIFDEYLIGSEVEISKLIISMLNSNSYIEQFKQVFEVSLRQMEEYGPIIIAEVIKRNIDQKVHMFTPRENETSKIYKELIRKGQEVGEITNLATPKDLLENIIYSAVGIATIWCSEDGTFSLIDKNHHMIDMLLQPKLKI